MERGMRKQTLGGLILLIAVILFIVIVQITNPTYFSPGMQIMQFDSLQDYFTKAPSLTEDLSNQEILNLINNEAQNQNNQQINDILNSLTNDQKVNVARGTSYGQSIANTWTENQKTTVLEFINSLFNNLPQDLQFASATPGNSRTDYFAQRSIVRQPIPLDDSCKDAGNEYGDGEVICTESPDGKPQTQTCKCTKQIGPVVCNWVLKTCESGEICIPTDNDDGEDPGCKRLA